MLDTAATSQWTASSSAMQWSWITTVAVVELALLRVSTWWHGSLTSLLTFLVEIKNPISLARLLLDHSGQPLSLRRVPPNFLAGQGATDFAFEHGMSVLPLDCLVSPSARDRWRQWRDDLERAEHNRRREDAARYGMSPPPSQSDLVQYYAQQPEQEQARRSHTNAMRSALSNEAQPVSPPPSDLRDPPDDSSTTPHSNTSAMPGRSSNSTTPDHHQEAMDPFGPPAFYINPSANPFSNSTQKMPNASTNMLGSNRNSDGGFLDDEWYGPELDFSDLGDPEPHHMEYAGLQLHSQRWHDGSSGSDSNSTTINMTDSGHPHRPTNNDRGGLHDAHRFPFPAPSPDTDMEPSTPKAQTPTNREDTPPTAQKRRLTDNGWVDGEDHVTDTVGAIAIDLYGNIACGASSGGIGMKHRGRIGPAALVGVGAAVKPADPEDAERTSVATVTSGTGEHMSTTTAASVCSERIYHNFRKLAGGRYHDCLEEEAIKGFIDKDFMGHPSVQASHSSGAIGVLSVKKTKDGAYLYYGHNTDSFAVASMHSNEAQPVCTMSRNKGNGQVAQGGRSIRNTKRKA